MVISDAVEFKLLLPTAYLQQKLMMNAFTNNMHFPIYFQVMHKINQISEVIDFIFSLITPI